jgi:hypothetical protein
MQSHILFQVSERSWVQDLFVQCYGLAQEHGRDRYLRKRGLLPCASD